MLQISYTISPEVREDLLSIDAKRQSILLTPVSPKHKRLIAWQTTLTRLSLLSPGWMTKTASKSDIERVLHDSHTHLGSQWQVLYNYKTALDYINEEWTANPQSVTSEVVEHLGSLLVSHTKPKVTIHVPFEEIHTLLTYLSPQNDHPVITAAIVYSQVSVMGMNQSVQLLALLLSYLYLYKGGYDLWGGLAIEDYIFSHPREHEVGLTTLRETGSSNLWVSFFVSGLKSCLQKTAEHVRDISSSAQPPIQLDLTERQKQILSRFDAPSLRITNKSVQKLLKISAITASRDLSRLSVLGLLYPHGKGRSVYYTKV